MFLCVIKQGMCVNLNQKIAEKVSEDFNAYLTSMDEMFNITLSAE